MAREDLVIRIAGEAGEGVSYHRPDGHSGHRPRRLLRPDRFGAARRDQGRLRFYQIRLSEQRLRSRGDSVDVLLAFNQEAFDNSIEHLREGGILIYDSAELIRPRATATARTPCR